MAIDRCCLCGRRRHSICAWNCVVAVSSINFGVYLFCCCCPFGCDFWITYVIAFNWMRAMIHYFPIQSKMRNSIWTITTNEHTHKYRWEWANLYSYSQCILISAWCYAKKETKKKKKEMRAMRRTKQHSNLFRNKSIFDSLQPNNKMHFDKSHVLHINTRCTHTHTHTRYYTTLLKNTHNPN